jgi:hypothetical protein
MTTKEKLISMLVEKGMFEQQAQKVMEVAIPEIEKKFNEGKENAYKFTWNRPAEEYPTPIYATLFISIKPIALKWIDDNIPNAWFREMFV